MMIFAMRSFARRAACGLLLLSSAPLHGSGGTPGSAGSTDRALHGTLRPGTVRIKDVASIEGVRDNQLVGYGLVVGLNGTGDRQQTLFTTQTLSAMLARMGVTVPAPQMMVRNVAAVFVSANLPPFARSGGRIDVTVSSAGDARSLEGGTLLMTPLRGVDGRVYATAQGPVAVGGYAASQNGTSTRVNHPTAGRIPEGALVEREVAVDLARMRTVAFMLHEDDFESATRMAEAIDRALGTQAARAVDSRRVEVEVAPGQAVPELLARLEALPVEVSTRAKVVVNERTGTVVIGSDVRLRPVSILHGGLEIDVVTEYQISQPAPFSSGQTATVPQTTVKASDKPVNRIELREGSTVDDLVRGLQSIGATARDVISILQAMRQAGALEAELEVI